MIRDIIERFSYRFALWRRQELPDYFPGSDANLTDIAKLAEDPKRRVVLTEPTMMHVARGFVTYFGVVGVIAIICRCAIAVFPSARSGIIVGLIAFVCFWGICAVMVIYKLSRAKAEYRSKNTNDLTNR